MIRTFFKDNLLQLRSAVFSWGKCVRLFNLAVSWKNIGNKIENVGYIFTYL